jgi:hypothetical protein
VLSIGTQFAAVHPHEETRCAAVKVPLDRRQRAHAVGDQALDATLQVGQPPIL